MKSVVLLLVTAMGLVLPALGANKTLVNVDKTGVALRGHDPVAFFTDGKPVKGDPKFATKRDGAVYLFATKEHRDAFVRDPRKYEPAYGGYCAYGVAQNKLVEIDVEAFQIVDGKLILQYSKSVRDTFNRDVKGNSAKAEANWPGLVEKQGKAPN